MLDLALVDKLVTEYGQPVPGTDAVLFTPEGAAAFLTAYTGRKISVRLVRFRWSIGRYPHYTLKTPRGRPLISYCTLPLLITADGAIQPWWLSRKKGYKRKKKPPPVQPRHHLKRAQAKIGLLRVRNLTRALMATDNWKRKKVPAPLPSPASHS